MSVVLIHTGLDNDLLTDSIKPLPQPTLTFHEYDPERHLTHWPLSDVAVILKV